MKSIRLSLLGLVALLVFACVKEEPQALKMGKPEKQDPTLLLEFSTNPAYLGEEMTISVGTNADCGQVSVERASIVNGDSVWTAISSPKPAVAGTPIVFSFTPDVTGEIAFRAHYTPSGGCTTWSEAKSTTYKLLVKKRCEGLKLDAKLVSAKRQAESNIFLFTVQYTVNTCDETYTNGKLQGGLTAIATLDSKNPDNAEVRLTNKNTIITWEEESLKGEKVYTVVFTKEIKGEAPYELTGNWSFKAYDKNGVLQTVGYDNALSFDGTEL